jgi:hypothetical protein
MSEVYKEIIQLQSFVVNCFATEKKNFAHRQALSNVIRCSLFFKRNVLIVRNNIV